MAATWLDAMPVSGAQYGGDELMKLRGEVARTPEAGPEVVEGWETTGRADGVRTVPTPLAGTGEASGTGFRGKLVSWMPAGMVRISLPC